MGGVTDLAATISRLMAQRKNTNSTIKSGTITGSDVLVDGKYYQYEVAVDIEIDDGETVYVMLNSDKSRAVIVGK
jgi:hypothetical protein